MHRSPDFFHTLCEIALNVPKVNILLSATQNKRVKNQRKPWELYWTSLAWNLRSKKFYVAAKISQSHETRSGTEEKCHGDVTNATPPIMWGRSGPEAMTIDCNRRRMWSWLKRPFSLRLEKHSLSWKRYLRMRRNDFLKETLSITV